MIFKRHFNFVFLTLAFLIAGCATIPREALNIPVLYIGGKEYVSLKNLCELKGVSFEQDSYAGVVSLKKDNLEARVLVGSGAAQINGIAADIKSIPVFYKGMVAVPVDFNQEVIAKLLKVETAKAEKVSPAFLYPINKIVIDAGHGGKDPGAIGKSGLRERDITLDVARRLKNELVKRGIEVVMTRDSDRFISLSRRCDITNESGADLFISIHVNANRARRIQGFEVYYVREATDSNLNKLASSGDCDYLFKDLAMDRSSRNVKPILLDMIYTQNRTEAVALAKCISSSAAKELSLKTRGIKQANFFVLKNTYIPAILIEIGYVSNVAEERYLKNSFYRQQLAESLAAGLLNFQKTCNLEYSKK